MRRYTYFEAGKWRIKVGDVEFAGPWVDKLSYYEELAPNLENTKDEAYNLGYQTCLHAKGLTWSEARELQAYRATGLTVERAAELGKADQEGRVVVLDEKTALSIAAGARAIATSKRLCGASYRLDVSKDSKKISYFEAANILYDITKKALEERNHA